MKNPYNKSQEAEYHHWQAGFSAKEESECPYEPDDSEYRHLRSIWMRGFKANKKTVKSEESKQMLNLDNVPTEELEKALASRKLKELEQLKQRKAQLQKTIADLETQITRLEILCQI